MNPRRQRKLELQPEALEDLEQWVAKDRKIALKILKLISAARKDPFDGIGKPEPLKHLCPDVWSRKITQQDRLVYRVTNDGIDVLQARFHY